MIERQLFERAQAGDEQALSVLLDRHNPLVYHVCRKWMLPGVEAEDKFEIGRLALWKSIMRFDLSRGLRFSTFATHVMENEMNRVRISQNAVKRRADREAISIETPLHADTTVTLADKLAMRAAAVEDTDAENAADRVEDLLARVGDRERQLLEARLEGLTLAEAGLLMGVSAQRAQQLFARIGDRYRSAA